MQSIIVKYHGPTNKRAAKMSATSTSGIRKYFSYDNAAKNNDERHRDAAKAFAVQMNWSGEWIGGAYNDAGATVWVRRWHDDRDTFTVGR